VLKSIGAEPERRMVNKPEDAFLLVQGDLERVYSIDDLDESGRIKNTTSLEIFRTSSPYFFSEQGKKRHFMFRVWARWYTLQYPSLLRCVDKIHRSPHSVHD
jgi:hypothetical protein